MFGIESEDGLTLLATVSPGGLAVIKRAVARMEAQTHQIQVNGQTVDAVAQVPVQSMEDTSTPYAMFAGMGDEEKAALRVVEVVSQPMPDTEEFNSTAKEPEKIDGVWTIGWESTARDQDAIKQRYKSMIDTRAEAVRQLFVTPGAGQAMVYQQKLSEAQLLKAGAEGTYPLLEASVGIEGTDVEAVADLVIATAEAWIGLAATIERLRLTAKKAVDDAEDIAVIRAAATVSWPTP